MIIVGTNPNLFAGRIDTSFVVGSGFNGTTGKINLQSDGKILIDGGNGTYNGAATGSITRLNTDGTRDASFTSDVGFNGFPITSLQSDGKLVVIGNFTTFTGSSAPGIVRLNSDGSRDTSFSAGTGFKSNVIFPGQTYGSVIQNNGKIIAVGLFDSYSGVSKNNIVCLNSNGTVDNSFAMGTGFNQIATDILIQPDQKIIVAGEFSQYNGTSVNKIVRLNSGGTIDTSFAPPSYNDYDYKLAIQSDGKILVGGSGFNVGTPSGRLQRLNSGGTVDSSFNVGVGFNARVFGIAIQSDGKILVGGEFTTYNGVVANRIIRLNTDGSIDNSFMPTYGFNDRVNDIFILPSDDMLVCGAFTTYQFESYNRLVKIKGTV